LRFIDRKNPQFEQALKLPTQGQPFFHTAAHFFHNNNLTIVCIDINSETAQGYTGMG
jgi:hypothetical protein